MLAMLGHQRVNRMDTNTRTYVDTTFCGWIFKPECWAILRNMNDLNLPWNASRAIFSSKIILRILFQVACRILLGNLIDFFWILSTVTFMVPARLTHTIPYPIYDCWEPRPSFEC